MAKERMIKRISDGHLTQYVDTEVHKKNSTAKILDTQIYSVFLLISYQETI